MRAGAWGSRRVGHGEGCSPWQGDASVRAGLGWAGEVLASQSSTTRQLRSLLGDAGCTLGSRVVTQHGGTAMPDVVAQFGAQLNTIMTVRTYPWGTLDEAHNCLAAIRLQQQALRALKANIKLHMQTIRQNYTVKRANVWAFFFDKRKATTRANQRRHLTQAEHRELAPYEQLTRSVDTYVLDLDRIKLQINLWMTANKPAGRQKS